MDKIKYIQIYGERNSGTNFLHKTLEDNLIDPPTIGYEYGWKHGFTNRGKIKKSNINEILFICVFKDPYAWISSMHEKPHHAPQLYFMDFSDFIREEWVCYKGKNYQKRAENLINDPVLPEQEMMQERHPITKKRFESVVHVRNTKNQYFLRLPLFAKHVIYLQYENFYLDPAESLSKFLTPYNLSFKENFKVSKAYHGKSKKLTWDKKLFYQEKRYLEKYSEEDLAYVNSILDFRQEKKLGYSIVENLKKVEI